MNSSWDSIGDDQYCKIDSMVSLLVALSIEMKNRHPSILYSSRGFLCAKLLTFTYQTLRGLNMSIRQAESEKKTDKGITVVTAELSLFMFTR